MRGKETDLVWRWTRQTETATIRMFTCQTRMTSASYSSEHYIKRIKNIRKCTLSHLLLHWMRIVCARFMRLFKFYGLNTWTFITFGLCGPVLDFKKQPETGRTDKINHILWYLWSRGSRWKNSKKVLRKTTKNQKVQF